MARTVRIAISGTDDFRSWLSDHLQDEGRRYMPTATLVVVEGSDLAVTCTGFSSCEEDDADHDVADRVRGVVEDVAGEYRDDEGHDRWGEWPEPSERQLERHNQRAIERACGGT